MIETEIEEEFEFWKSLQFKNVIPGRYLISDLGRIKDLKRNKIIPIHYSEKGYAMVGLVIISKHGHQRTVKLHRLVALHWVSGKSDEKCEVDHIDADKSNNRANNLEWVTHLENIRRANEKGIIPYKSGIEMYNAKFNENQIRLIRALFDENLPRKIIRRICNKMGFDFTSSDFYDISRGISYKNVR